ncbi:MAG TPA: DUF6578 domain-containing protein [Pseudonocardia sp.]|nr:DUF6578 domain-containing protein [Pseudonocardia sp.]
MRRHVIAVMISDWEIECCAPPPVIGAESTWRLEFLADTDETPDNEAGHEDIWTVTHDPRGTAFLERNGIHAMWNSHPAPPPPPGIHTLRGLLHGTAHGGTVPDSLTPVTGRVQRVRLVSYEFEWDPVEERTLRYRPGTRTLHDVREGPRWFNEGPVGPGRQNTGVLIDLAVPAR